MQIRSQVPLKVDSSGLIALPDIYLPPEDLSLDKTEWCLRNDPEFNPNVKRNCDPIIQIVYEQNTYDHHEDPRIIPPPSIPVKKSCFDYSFDEMMKEATAYFKDLRKKLNI
ncbi:MAG: hypothetical protein PW999_21335 [Paraburkholderia tropica]|nr:hypothetical protein [Paraburkholderia tropica]